MDSLVWLRRESIKVLAFRLYAHFCENYLPILAAGSTTWNAPHRTPRLDAPCRHLPPSGGPTSPWSLPTSLHQLPTLPGISFIFLTLTCLEILLICVIIYISLGHFLFSVVSFLCQTGYSSLAFYKYVNYYAATKESYSKLISRPLRIS
jgi:hypothetical protein